jgi:hypothetical protein
MGTDESISRSMLKRGTKRTPAAWFGAAGALLALCTAAVVFAATQLANACACCSSRGERMDLLSPLDSFYSDELSHLRFGDTAELFLGEADPEDVKGIATPAAKYDLQASWSSKDGMRFSFRDKDGRTGTLSFARPRTISTFSVDTREGESDQESRLSREPALYKEWRLTAKAAGTGIFVPGLGQSQTLTLVLQGRGNSCPGAHQFTHWMLVMRGPAAKYHFFGDMRTAQ